MYFQFVVMLFLLFLFEKTSYRFEERDLLLIMYVIKRKEASINILF